MAPNTPKLSDQVRTIGRKVRALLDDEVKNRREIQRVEPSLTAPDGKSAVVIAVPKIKKQAAKPQARKRKFKPQAVEDSKNVDRWMPLIDHLPEANDTSNQSSLVQLHGLPHGVTATQIRRFFSGMQIQRLVLFPKFECSIRELDAVPTPGKKPAARRYGASSLRSFVKFESVLTAASAVQRSGEIVRLDDNVGVAVRLTVVPKAYASLLLNTLAVDCSLQDTQPIHQAIERVEVDELVAGILWTEAIQTLQLTTTEDLVLPESITYPILPRHKKVSFQLSTVQVEWLRERRNVLSKYVSQLRDQLPFPSAECFDPTIDDTLLRLNTNCSEIVQTEIDRVDHHLLVASKWQILLSSTSSGSNSR